MTSSPCRISKTRTVPSRYPIPITSIAGDWTSEVTGEEEEEGWGKVWISELRVSDVAKSHRAPSFDVP
jgi:hypothetical protein